MASAGAGDPVKNAVSLAALVERARDPSASLQEQHAAFGQLVHESQHIVFGLALAALGDVDEAKDAAQDAFATAWHRIRQLRDPVAFPAWMRAIVATTCSRRRRMRARLLRDPEERSSVASDDRLLDYQSVVSSALDRLSKSERDVAVLFYFLGHTQVQIAKLLRLKPGTVGKRLHSARLRIRRGLPQSVRADFVRLTPSKEFVEQVSRGLLDEYVGQYRFDSRPDHVVTLRREGDSLISEGGGQQHILVSLGQGSLLAVNYDGEGRFRRNRRGEVTHFVYYEFGKRIGIARKTSSR
jgi:RNA polymerase sigma-70 factor (ECF subfamily)